MQCHAATRKGAKSTNQQASRLCVINFMLRFLVVKGCVHLDGYRDYARVDHHHGVLTYYSKTIRLGETEEIQKH